MRAISGFYHFFKVQSENDVIRNSPAGANKVIAVGMAAFRQLAHMIDYSCRWSSLPDYHKLDETRVYKKSSAGLVVFIHGLRSHPSKWKYHISKVKENPQLDFFAPFVPKQGLCPLQEATAPIFDHIIKYTQEHPGKPVCLIGHSNGARIAINIEEMMRSSAPATPVNVSGIAGPHLGSSMMNLAEKLCFARLFYPSEVRKEMGYKSEPAKSLMSRVKQPFAREVAPRTYEFFGSSEDFSVRGEGSALPILGKGEERWLCSGHSHDSIVDAVMEKQMNSILQKCKSSNSL